MALTQVSTDGVKNDAITKTKIPANQIEASELADNAVDTNAIADQAVALSKLPHGTSSNDGKFLRANNGADPSFETITGTTINNNADNRVITGSGTANTLNGESTLTYGGTELLISNASPSVKLNDTDNSGVVDINNVGGAAVIESTGVTTFTTNAAERLRIDTSGNVGIGTTSPSVKLHVNGGSGLLVERSSGTSIAGFKHSGASAMNIYFQNSGSTNHPSIGSSNEDLTIGTNNNERLRVLSGGGLTFNGDTAAANALNDYEEGTFTPTIFVEGQSNTSLSLAIGRYVKIGRTVHIHFEVQLNGTPSNRSTSNAWQFGNFPFNPVQYNSSPAGGIRDYRYPMIAMGVDTSSTYGSNGHFVLRLFDYTTSGRIEWQHSDLSLKNASLFMQDGAVVQFAVTYCTG